LTAQPTVSPSFSTPHLTPTFSSPQSRSEPFDPQAVGEFLAATQSLHGSVDDTATLWQRILSKAGALWDSVWTTIYDFLVRRGIFTPRVGTLDSPVAADA